MAKGKREGVRDGRKGRVRGGGGEGKGVGEGGTGEEGFQGKRRRGEEGQRGGGGGGSGGGGEGARGRRASEKRGGRGGGGGEGGGGGGRGGGSERRGGGGGRGSGGCGKGTAQKANRDTASPGTHPRAEPRTTGGAAVDQGPLAGVGYSMSQASGSGRAPCAGWSAGSGMASSLPSSGHPALDAPLRTRSQATGWSGTTCPPATASIPMRQLSKGLHTGV